MTKLNFHENLTEFDEASVSSNRSFGITFAVVFIILGCLPLINHQSPRYSLLGAAVILFVISLIHSSLLAYPNLIWSKFGLMLGKLMTPIILGGMFFILLTPMAFILRAMGKDLLSLRLQNDQRSYWVERDPPGPEPESLRQQF